MSLRGLNDKWVYLITAVSAVLAIDFTLKPVLSELGARHILGVLYAVDKPVTWTETQTVILEEESDQKLKQSLEELLKAVKH